MPTPEKTDWAGIWFRLLEEQGEYTGIRFGRLGPGASEPEWTYLPHEDYDGVGGFSALLRERGIDPGALPELRPAGRAPLSAQLKAFARAMSRKPAPGALWRGLGLERISAVRAHRAWHPASPHEACAWEVFSSEDTAELLASAREKGITLNSLLLAALNRAVAPGLEPAELSRAWMIPVNLRGGVRLADQTSNHSAFLDLRLLPGSSDEGTHAEVLASLRRAEHWGTWHVLRLGRWVGTNGVRRIRDANQRQGAAWAGAFSNLGAWRGGPGGPNDEDDGSAWLFCPPAALGAPLAAGALTWNGRLALCLQLHPALSREPRDATHWLESWKESLHASVARRAAGRAGSRGFPGRDRSPERVQDQV